MSSAQESSKTAGRCEAPAGTAALACTPAKTPQGPFVEKGADSFSLCGSLRDLDGSVLPPNCTLPSVVTKTWSEVLQRKRHDAHIVSYCTLHMSILMGLEVQSLRHEMGHTARHAGT